MRLLFTALAATALAACETMPEFMQAPPTQAVDNGYVAPPPPPDAFMPPPDQQLLELERQLSATAQDRGLGGALASVMDPTEGVAVRSGVVYSVADIETGLAPPRNAGPIYWQPDRVHVANAGDMGVTSGRYVQVMTGAEAVQGRYLVVWRRDSAGDWRILTETRIADPPRRRR